MTAAVAEHAITRLAVRQVRRGGLIVLAVTAGMSALVANTYESTMGTEADLATLMALGGNPAVRTLFGEPVALDTPGGFTVWRTGTVLAVLLSVWGLLAVTRITRGEEEAGRWSLLLAGRLDLRAVLGRHLLVLAVVLATVGVAVTAALVAVGTPASGAIRHGAGLALAGLFAVALATLAAQVFPTRAGATGATVAVLGVGLLSRMVGEGVDALAWLRWLSPFGLLALTRPYHDDRVLPLVVLAAGTLAVGAAAVLLAGRRDVGGGLVAGATGRQPRRLLLGSVQGFALRRLLRPLAGWVAGVGAYFLLIGVLAESMTRFLSDNPRFADLAAQAGFTGLGSVRGYAASMFALLAVPVGTFAAVRLGAFAAAEADRRLTPLYALPVTRHRVLGAEVFTVVAGSVVLLAAAAVATWAGAATVDADLPLAAALAGTLNVLPVVLLCAGAAVLAVGWAPRAVAGIGSLPAAGGFLLQVVADSVDAPGWVRNLSPFAHLAAVPATGVNWPAVLTMVVLALVAAGFGMAGHQRRDLIG